MTKPKITRLFYSGKDYREKKTKARAIKFYDRDGRAIEIGFADNGRIIITGLMKGLIVRAIASNTITVESST